jgi:hypothetical protein
MGVVWHAHDTLLGRDVAVKEIYLPTSGTEPADPSDPVLRRALREARAAAKLRHPAIITVHDVATDDGRPWIVMELIDGRSLADAIREQGLLTVQRAAEIGLGYGDGPPHRQGVLHRDVKPANILLDGDRVVLTDFGIASIDDATALTATGQLVGSPAYLAPERINGRPTTAAADVWALGVTLYAAITGRSPFHRADTQATLAAVLTSRPDPPAHAGLLWPVIKGMLAKDPAQRLSANQAAPLLAAVAGRPATAQPAATPSGRGRPRWWQTRPRSRSTDDDLTRTAVAPPPTVAAPTAAKQAEPATLAGTTEVRPGATTASPTVTADTVAQPTAQPRRPLLTRVPVLVGLLVLAASIPAGIVALVDRQQAHAPAADSGIPSRAASPAPASSRAPAAGPTPSATPTSAAQCLIGTWLQTSNRATWSVNGRNVPVTSEGTINTFTANGMAVVEYRGAGVTRRGTAGGNTYEITTVGIITFNYDASDNNTIYLSQPEATGTITTRVNGKVIERGTMIGSVVPERYRCTGDSLQFWNDRWTIDAVRTSPT